MKFAEPQFLYAIPALWALMALILAAARRRRGDLLRRFVGPSTAAWALSGRSSRRSVWDHALAFLVIGFLLATLARPLYFREDPRSELQGAPYLVALDASRSMLANDVKPSRFAAATNALDRHFSSSRADRIGLITFSGVAYLNAPLTFDTTALRTILGYLNPHALVDPGSSLSAVLDRAGRFFTSNALPTRVLVLLSDGEDLDPRTLPLARRLHRDHQLVVHTIGVGTATGTTIPALRTASPNRPTSVPSPRADPATPNPGPSSIVTRLDEINLQRLANATGGRYFRLGTDGEGLRQLRDEVLRPLAQEEARNDLRNYREAAFVPLGLAFVALIVRLLLGADRAVRQRPLPSILHARS